MNVDTASVRKRVLFLRWALPLAIIFLVAVYQFALSSWLQNNSFFPVHDNSGVLIVVAAVSFLVFLMIRQIGVWLDQARQIQEQASANNNQLALIATALVDAIVGLDTLGHITAWNRGAEQLLGFETTAVQGHPLSELFGGGPAAEVESRWLQDEVKRAGFVRGHETSCTSANGTRLGIEMSATQLRNEHGDPAGMALVLHDISLRKQKEEETQRLNRSLNQQAAQRNRELAVKVQELKRVNVDLQKLDQTRSEFVSLVSHQIRAPLTNMGGAVQRMQADCGAINPTCMRMFTILEKQVSRLDRLVQDVLNAARLEAGEFLLHLEPISIMATARQASREIRARSLGRPIELEDKPGLPLVYADRDRVVEVLSNLLDNADKYSPPGKQIAIQVRADQTEVTVSVRDRGPGVPPQDLGRVFDKFYRADSSDAQAVYGYGLGLYVCWQLMVAQGGRIWAENHPDGGALFSIALPVWQENHG